ncbi:MAG: hypothetical protein HOH33_13345 [Verrucomicrobia bacterium]|nr:hypothetical protein [Verrucomicrobiota bacterium]
MSDEKLRANFPFLQHTWMDHGTKKLALEPDQSVEPDYNEPHITQVKL